MDLSVFVQMEKYCLKLIAYFVVHTVGRIELRFESFLNSFCRTINKQGEPVFKASFYGQWKTFKQMLNMFGSSLFSSLNLL